MSMQRVVPQQELYCFRKKASIISTSPSEHGQYIEYILTVLEEVNAKINRLNTDWERRFSELVSQIESRGEKSERDLQLQIEKVRELFREEVQNLQVQFKVSLV